MRRVTRRELAALVLGVALGAAGALVVPRMGRAGGPEVVVQQATKLHPSLPFESFGDPASNERLAEVLLEVHRAVRADSPGARALPVGSVPALQLETVLCSPDYLRDLVGAHAERLRWAAVKHVECAAGGKVWAAAVSFTSAKRH